MLWYRRRLHLASVLALALALGVGAAADSRPDARLVGKVPTLVAGRAWTATVRVTPPPARPPELFARMGPRSARFAMHRLRRGVYRADVRLRSPGTWRLAVELGSRRFALATVRVASATLALDQPAQILVAEDGSILVAERGGRDRIARVDPVTGVVTTFATGLSDPFGLAYAPDRSILVSAGGAIHRVPARGGRPVVLVRVDAGPIAAAPNGDLYFANRSELGRVRAGSTSPELLPVQVSAPHALVLDGDTLFVADSGNRRILEVELATGRATPLATGFQVPLGLAADSAGGLLAADYAAGTVERVSRAGDRRPVASGLARPYAIAVARETVYVVEAGQLGRATGGIKRVLADGSVAPLRLRRG